MRRFLLLSLVLIGCGSGATPDGGIAADSGVLDSGASDAATSDSGGSDAGGDSGGDADAGSDAGPPCTAGTSRCDDASQLSSCTGGAWTSFDCSAIGLACVTGVDGAGCGEAVCWDGERRCEAGTLLTCAGRRWSLAERCPEGVCRTFGVLAICGAPSDATTATPLFEYGPLEIVEWANGTGGLALDRRTVFTYDAMKRVEETVLSSYSSGAWTELERTTYTYNAYGVATTTIHYMIDGAWTPRELWTRVYDASGRLVENGRQYINLGMLQPSTYRNEYEYNTDGSFHLERVRTFDGSTWRGEWFRIYSYDAPTSVLHMAFATYGSGGRDNDVDRYLDATGKLAFVHYRWTAEVIESDYGVYAYDPEGFVASIVDYSAATHTPDYRVIFTRGTDARLVRREAEGFFDGAWTPGARVDITHTDLGSSRTFEMHPVPVRSWVTDYYGSGAVVPVP